MSFLTSNKNQYHQEKIISVLSIGALYSVSKKPEQKIKMLFTPKKNSTINEQKFQLNKLRQKF